MHDISFAENVKGRWDSEGGGNPNMYRFELEWDEMVGECFAS